jgi:hypothetical protein
MHLARAGRRTFPVVVCMEHDEDVLDEADEGERPQDEAEDAEQVVLVGVRQGEGREGVERRRPDVAVHHAQRLVGQQRHLPRRELLHARMGRPAAGGGAAIDQYVAAYLDRKQWRCAGGGTYQRVAVPHPVRLAEGAAGEAAGADDRLDIVVVAAVDLLNLARRAPVIHGGHRGGAHLDDDVVRQRRRVVLHRAASVRRTNAL